MTRDVLLIVAAVVVAAALLLIVQPLASPEQRACKAVPGTWARGTWETCP